MRSSVTRYSCAEGLGRQIVLCKGFGPQVLMCKKLGSQDFFLYSKTVEIPGPQMFLLLSLRDDSVLLTAWKVRRTWGRANILGRGKLIGGRGLHLGRRRRRRCRRAGFPHPPYP